MNWNSQDNKKQTGEVDRIYVSSTEYYELSYYVDDYLQGNGFKINDNNREIVTKEIKACPYEPPLLRDALTKYLNGKFKK